MLAGRRAGRAETRCMLVPGGLRLHLCARECARRPGSAELPARAASSCARSLLSMAPRAHGPPACLLGAPMLPADGQAAAAWRCRQQARRQAQQQQRRQHRARRRAPRVRLSNCPVNNGSSKVLASATSSWQQEPKGSSQPATRHSFHCALPCLTMQSVPVARCQQSIDVLASYPASFPVLRARVSTSPSHDFMHAPGNHHALWAVGSSAHALLSPHRLPL